MGHGAGSTLHSNYGRHPYDLAALAYLRDGVSKLSVFEAAVGPLGPFATTLTVYCVPGCRPLNTAYGVALVTVTGAPPPTGVAVKV